MTISWSGVCLIACVSAAGGCPQREPVNPSTTAAGRAPCEATAQHLVTLLQPGGAEPELIARITHALAERCIEDHWTMDAQQCFLGITAIDAGHTCAQLLTIDQRDKFDAALGAAIGGKP